MALKFPSFLNGNLSLNLLLWSGIFCYYSSYDLVRAQVVKDETLSTEVNTENNRDFTVNNGEQRGNNLFHSFAEFSIPKNGSVLFHNSRSIENIITRVTGSSISHINGLIQSNGTANLFLINPNGIIFGENARLDIGGSFLGTTAESLVFEDGTEFSSNPHNSEPLLTVNVPLGLQFGNNPDEITNQANFTIPNPQDPSDRNQIKSGLTTLGKTLALLGGDITFDGGAVTTSGGNIELGSVGDNSLVILESFQQGWKANYDNVSQFKNIKLDNLASVDASGEGGGNINVRSNNLQILNGSEIAANTLGNLDGETIKIQTDNLLEVKGSDRTGTKIDPLLASVEIFLPSASQVSSNTFGAGKGGDVEIVTQDLRLTDGGGVVLQTIPGSTADGGDLSIAATKSIKLAGTRPLLGIGNNAENIILPTLSLDTAIEINQGSEISVTSINEGNAGDINIFAQNISLKDGASIGAVPFSSGDGGNITIDAAQSIEVVGASPRTGSASSVIAVSTLAEGNSGNIKISAENLRLIDGGQILSSSSSIGDAGDIELNTLSTKISGFRSSNKSPSLISARATAGGDGGNIFMNTGNLTISDRASLSVRGAGSSVSGNLMVNAKSIELNSFSSITATTEFQSGGNITLKIEEDLTLKDNSLISAQAFNNANGGNLNLEVGFLIANPNENNDILATAVEGDGGNINIQGDGIFGIQARKSRPPNFSNDIDASSEFGMDGIVILNIPNFQEFRSLLARAQGLIDVDYLLKNNFCNLSRDSEYYVVGKGGMAFTIDDDLPVADSWSDWRFLDSGESQAAVPVPTTADEPRKLEMIQGWTSDRQGRIVLTADASQVTPHQPPSPNYDCSSIDNY